LDVRLPNKEPSGVIELFKVTHKVVVDSTAVQRDRLFEGRLVWRISRQQATLDESRILLAETERILALIATETD
jgi:hypothetical protein